ncbi:MAG: cyclic nucleotide-binding domain-containing protein [Treponema sp.]|jgi:CRP-like cAMP-binding protein|nr:cyclic nucleotide-binding domain-containing protein [Treponema sp.]
MMIEAAHLQRYALFGGLSEEQIETILPLMHQGSFEEGQLILEEGTPQTRLFFILEGKVSVTKMGLPLREFSEGDTFGEMEVLDVMPGAATIRAVTPVQVMWMSNNDLHAIYKSDIHAFSMVIMNLARDLSRRLRLMDSRLVTESPAMEWN